MGPLAPSGADGGWTVVPTTVGRRKGPTGPMGPSPKPNYRPCRDFVLRKNSFCQRNTRIYENRTEPWRCYESIATSSASRSLLRIRKQRETIITKHPLWGEGDGDDDGRIFQRPPPPIPSHPGMKYTVRASSSLRLDVSIGR